MIDSEYSDYAKFMACTTAHYLDAKSKYDPMALFFSTKINPIPYQIYDFHRLIEEYRKSGNIRALIAYETGLGKTILIGMIIKELVSPRFEFEYKREKRILILTPPSALPQFQDEMKRKFDLDFERFDTKKGKFGNMVIASIDTLKFNPWVEYLKDQVWDIIVVDEFHRLNSFNLRGELIEILTNKTKSLIGLTATPHDGKSERYSFRLNVISKSPIIIRRTKKKVLDINNKKIFDQEVFEKKEEFEVTLGELSFYDKAEQYARKRFAETGAGALVAMVIGRAVSSSIRAGLKMLKKRRQKLIAEEFVDEELDDDLEDLIEKVNHSYELSNYDIDRILGARPQNLQALEEELNLINPVIETGDRIIATNPIDSKGRYVLELIRNIRQENRKCLIYTGFLETVDYLRELLKKEGYEVLEITGRVSMDDRNLIVEDFTENENLNIIIGTDAMGESLNLQAASAEINYEIPWSPVSYIQRVGRIWRYGQRHHELYIHNFLPQFKVERRVMEVILEKIKTINKDFGEVGLSVFGEELGSIDNLVKKAYSEDIIDQVDEAERKSLEIGQEVMERIMGSMVLPQVVNVEELHKNNMVRLDDAFSEEDLLQFLEYVKDAGVASGDFSDDKKKISTYHVKGEKDFHEVQRISLDDKGIKIAIEMCKALKDSFNACFNHSKKMEGKLSVYQVNLDGRIVYEEPVLVTPEGVLIYRGIRDLSPSFSESTSKISFKSLEAYKSETEETWLDFLLTKFYEEGKFKQKVYIEEKNPHRREVLGKEFKDHVAAKPSKCTVEEKSEICRVRFIKLLGETALLGIREVEEFGMGKAIEYYESQGYLVDDIHEDLYKGYDIECTRADGILRVEVKGLKGSRYPLMTPNEHSKAMFYREGYVLFIVKIRDNGYSLYAILDPVYNVDMIEISRPIYQVRGYENFQVAREVRHSLPILKIDQQEMRLVAEIGYLDELLSGYKYEQREQVKKGLSSWIDEKLQGRGLQLTEEAKITWVNLIALVMKKVSKMLNDSEGDYIG